MILPSRAHARSTTPRRGRRAIAVALGALLTGALALGAVAPAQASGPEAPMMPGVTASRVDSDVDIANATFSVSRGQFVADGVQGPTISVILRDVDGTPASGQASNLTAHSMGVSGVRIAPFVQAVDGSYYARVSSTTAGIAHMNVQWAGMAIRLADRENGEATFIAGQVDVFTSTSHVTPETGPAGERKRVSASLVDRYGNPVSGVIVEVAAPSWVTLQPSITMSDAVGRADFFVTAHEAGTAEITVTHDNQPIGGPLTAEWTAPPAKIGSATLKVSSHEAIANGTDQVVAEVEVLDEHGASFDGDVDVVIHSSFTPLVPPATRADGRTAVLTSETPGTTVVTFTIDGVLWDQSEEITFAAAPTGPEVEGPGTVDPGIEKPGTVDPGVEGSATENPAVVSNDVRELALTGTDAPAWPIGLFAGALGSLGILLLVLRRRIVADV